MDAKTVGKKIAELRKKNNMTQKELASKLNVIDKTVSRWECGYGLPDLSLIPEIAAIFNTSIEELLGTNVDITSDVATETVKAEAEAVVRELVLVYYLADVLGVEINDTLVNEYYQNSNMYIYYYYYYGSFPEQFETAYVFDKVVEGLLSKYTLASYPEA